MGMMEAIPSIHPLIVLPGRTGGPKNLFYRWALDTTADFLLGENVNCLDHPNTEVSHAMSVAQRIQMLIFVFKQGDYYRAIRKIEEFMEPFIARAIALPESELEKLSQSDMQFTFLHSIVRVSEDPKPIPAWARLRGEVLDVLGSNEKPTYAALKDFKYVKNVLNETLRLHPAVPLNMRQALEATTIPGASGERDIVLLKGDTVTINTLGMHARRDLYPTVSETFADPAIFNPERWESWTPKLWTANKGAPVVRLAQRYERVEYRGDWEAQSLRADIIGTPALGVPVALFEPRLQGHDDA
ncbi:Cytochrome P450 52A13 [Tolypocladium ophioglossoides CBS 100239]|uniref:Cytochrome P450 52A13 n=1 Tax=Tolypocladium ophioglossoides (strain CBS 100239) TaxID=1163406 RepID=A0A0L0NK82_TOLOC|nr:Cytochrome P450 52A13 [Tolypocladium ophioglossoides CBS 100239]